MADRVVRSHTADSQAILPERFLTDLPHVFSREGSLIYKGRNEVRFVQVGPHKLVIKKFGIPFILNRLFYSLGIRTPKAVRSFQNAQQILAKGFRTPRPLAQELHYRGGLLGDSYFISEWAEGASVASARKSGNLVRALARYTAQLHAAGMMHRDYILSNILFTKEGDTYQFELIDINRFIFQRGALDFFHVCTNLMQPFHDDKKIKVFVTEYARARQLNAKVLVWWVLRFRHLRSGYSQLKKFLRRLPGARCFSSQANRDYKKRHR